MLRMLAKIHCGTVLLLLVIVVESQHVNTSDLVKLPSQQGEIKFRADRVAVEPGKIPYQVFFKQPAKGDYANFCSGGLISKDKILTSAECFVMKRNSCEKMCKQTPIRKLKSLYAVAGNVEDKTKYKEDKASSEQWRTIKSVHIAPGFNHPKNDIAVVFTSKPFIPNANVVIATYSTKNMNYKADAECMDSVFSKKEKIYGLYYRMVSLRSKSQCKQVHGQNMDDYLCISRSLPGVQWTNRGSPLVCVGTGDPKEVVGMLVGILSGYRKKRNQWHPYYTRVAKHQAFIKKRASRNVPLLNIVWIPLIMSNFV